MCIDVYIRIMYAHMYIHIMYKYIYIYIKYLNSVEERKKLVNNRPEE